MVGKFFSRVGISAAGFDFSNLFNFINEVLKTALFFSSTFVEADPENEVQMLNEGVVVGGESDKRTFGCEIRELQTGKTSLYQGPKILGSLAVEKQVGDCFVQR